MVLKEQDQNIMEQETEIKDDIEPTKPFTLEILKVIKDSHQQHGLRHGDYQRYRGYCSRRIARLRKVLKLPQGDRRHFKRKDVTEVHVTNPKIDDKCLQLPLMMAERNWAYAMQLRQESNTEPRKKFHFIQKLRKACVYSEQLEELCKFDRCDARTKLEAQAYVAWMHGTLHFELQLWPKATENLKKAQVIYEKLSSALPEDEQALYMKRVEEIKPSLRYCAYNIGDQKIDLLELRSQGILENYETLVTQTKEKTAAVLHEVSWFGIKVPIRMDRVRLFMVSIEKLDESLAHADTVQAKIKILEDMLMDLRDVIAEVRKVVTENKEQLLLSYLLSIRIDRTVQRNLLLIKQTKKPQDVCRLLDIILQQLNEVMQFEQLQGDKKAETQYNDQVLAYRALRAFYMAKTHALFRRWKEAAVTFNICEERAREVKGKKFIAILQELLDNLVTNSQVEKAVAHANVVLEKCEEEAAPVPQKAYKSKKPLIERLDEFREDPQLLTKNPNVVTIPCPMEPVAPKPLFYDLALNYVQMPEELQDKIDGGKKDQSKQQSGISGFVKGLWGWGK
ncbi:PREDICTED: signal recognition particle subunit SRP68 [Nicrophorus vespilloides]|uniref:Signal recognition particle subunit SRP68 n=1 Tax=Nicrophorus vespilloides TaxID=110193 RepID=A0ABM1M7H6_NICVS|nr:PREDICTED: signal recognition particle subunit SRP68 [Nicrophorus vespilloides]